MPNRHALLSLLLTSSLFLVHCSSGDDDAQSNSGAGGTGGSAAGSVGTGGSTSGSAGTTSGAGMPGSGGSSAAGGSSGTSSGAGQGGSSGAAARGGSGGMTTAGRGGMAGGGGASAGSAGKAGSGAGGASTGGMGGIAGSATGGVGGAVGAGSGGRGTAGAGGSSTGAFTLTSSVITEGGMFPDMNTCASTSDSSPDLTWTAGPSGTLSYAVILFDTSNSLNHWVIWDIPASVTSLPAMLGSSAMLTMPAGAMQKAIQGNGYYGPCPQGMDHVYKFTVYALPVATLSGAMTSMQTSQLATAVMNANPLASASLSAHSAAKPAN